MKKILFGLALVSGAALTSCKGYLDEEPKLKQSNEITFSDFESLNSAGAALYGMMQSASWYDGEFILNGELRCGNAKNPLSVSGSGRYRVQTQWNFNESSTYSLWSYAYYTIARANNVINNIKEELKIDDVTQEDLDNLKAEALFMRALSYHNLICVYAQPYNNNTDTLGVPVVTVTENGTPARASVKTVYNQIEKDLLEAESLISSDFSRSGVTDPAAVASKWSIKALLSRVYLYMEKWQKAADYATEVINSGKYALMSGDAYINSYASDVTPTGGEVIFEVYGSQKNDYWDDSGWTHLPYITREDGYGDICATSDLYDLFADGDIRQKFFYTNNGDIFCTKYAGKEGADPKQTNVPIIRIAEMYLNRAEALLKGASIPGCSAQADLETLAAARGTKASNATTEGVFTDRRKELFFEGHIAFDYARCNRSLTRTDFDDVSNKDVPYPSYMWAMPIPKREMDANPSMVQNPGY